MKRLMLITALFVGAVTVANAASAQIPAVYFALTQFAEDHGRGLNQDRLTPDARPVTLPARGSNPLALALSYFNPDFVAQSEFHGTAGETREERRPLFAIEYLDMLRGESRAVE